MAAGTPKPQFFMAYGLLLGTVSAGVADAMIKAYEHAPAERQRPLNIVVRYSYTDP
jgi:hypothetical protein